MNSIYHMSNFLAISTTGFCHHLLTAASKKATPNNLLYWMTSLNFDNGFPSLELCLLVLHIYKHTHVHTYIYTCICTDSRMQHIISETACNPHVIVIFSVCSKCFTFVSSFHFLFGFFPKYLPRKLNTRILVPCSLIWREIFLV